MMTPMCAHYLTHTYVSGLGLHVLREEDLGSFPKNVHQEQRERDGARERDGGRVGIAPVRIGTIFLINLNQIIFHFSYL